MGAGNRAKLVAQSLCQNVRSEPVAGDGWSISSVSVFDGFDTPSATQPKGSLVTSFSFSATLRVDGRRPVLSHVFLSLDGTSSDGRSFEDCLPSGGSRSNRAKPQAGVMMAS